MRNALRCQCSDSKRGINKIENRCECFLLMGREWKITTRGNGENWGSSVQRKLVIFWGTGGRLGQKKKFKQKKSKNNLIAKYRMIDHSSQKITYINGKVGKSNRWANHGADKLILVDIVVGRAISTETESLQKRENQ